MKTLDRNPDKCTHNKLTPLRCKVFLYVATLCFAVNAILYLGLSKYITERFLTIESNIANQNIQQANEAIQANIDQLLVMAEDYSNWDATYQFINDLNQEYIDSNIGDPYALLDNLQNHLLLFVNLHGDIVYGLSIDNGDDKCNDNYLATGTHLLARHDNLKNHQNIDSSHSGIIIMPQGPMLVASTPILTSNYEGPIRGALIFGRYLNDQFIQELADQTKLNLAFNTIEDTDIIPSPNQQSNIIKLVNDHTINAYAPLNDLNNRQFGWIKMTSDRPINLEAKRSIAFLFFACLIVGLVLCITTITVVNKLIVKRVGRIVKWVNNISSSRDISLRTELATDDELGELTDAINHMLAVFDKSETQNRETQRSLATLMQNLPGMAYRRKHDQDWSIIFASQGAIELTGYPPQMLVQDQAKFASLIHEEDHQRVFNEINDAIENNMPFRVAYRIKTKDNDPKWVWEQGAAVKDDDNNIIAIEGFIADITDSKTAQHELQDLATHDQLTGLPNRTQIIERINQAIEKSQTDFNHQFALIYIDVDRFKVINDSMGHGDGDKLLQQIAERIINCIKISLPDADSPPNDSVFRLGGDEFAIMLEPMKLSSDAEKIASQIKQQITEPFHLNNRAIHITASMGIVTSDIGHDSADDMIRDADTAMYHAKSNGRDRHAIFNKTMYFQALERMEIEHEMRSGLEKNEFFLAYQPVLILESGQLCGFEALVRWQHPARGIVPPLQFIPLAEETGLIIQLGEFVLETACKQLVKWQPIYGQNPPLKMAVNLSRRQLVEPGLVDMIKSVIERTGIDPNWLDLEITENSIMEDLGKVMPILNEIRDLGIKLSMDDFGTGHSSMSHLHKFPIDILKIDRAFVANMGMNTEYAAITQAIIDLAHNLNMKVIAEGIEEPGQLAQLQALECDMAQGFFFSKPLPTAEIEPWIEARDIKEAG